MMMMIMMMMTLIFEHLFTSREVLSSVTITMIALCSRFLVLTLQGTLPSCHLMAPTVKTLRSLSKYEEKGRIIVNINAC
jgi:hypothetical protein